MASCKIIIKDEVNIKIENLDLDARKALVKKFKYEDPTARFRPAYKLGRWDGSISFFGLGGENLEDKVPKMIPTDFFLPMSTSMYDLRVKG